MIAVQFLMETLRFSHNFVPQTILREKKVTQMKTQMWNVMTPLRFQRSLMELPNDRFAIEHLPSVWIMFW